MSDFVTPEELAAMRRVMERIGVPNSPSLRVFDALEAAWKERDDARAEVKAIRAAILEYQQAPAAMEAAMDREEEHIHTLAHIGSIPAVQSAVVELDLAAAKFPTWPTDPFHAAAVLGEEVGELNKALIQTIYEPDKGVSIEHVRDEARQVAAMALRFLQGMRHYQFLPCAQHDQPSRGVA